MTNTNTSIQPLLLFGIEQDKQSKPAYSDDRNAYRYTDRYVLATSYIITVTVTVIQGKGCYVGD